MLHYRSESMFRSIVFEEELVAIISYLLNVRCEHTVYSLYKRLYRITWAIKPIAVLFRQCAGVAV